MCSLTLPAVRAQQSQLCDSNFNAQFSFSSYPRTKGEQSIYKAYIFSCSCIDSLKADLVPRL